MVYNQRKLAYYQKCGELWLTIVQHILTMVYNLYNMEHHCGKPKLTVVCDSTVVTCAWYTIVHHIRTKGMLLSQRSTPLW